MLRKQEGFVGISLLLQIVLVGTTVSLISGSQLKCCAEQKITPSRPDVVAQIEKTGGSPESTVAAIPEASIVGVLASAEASVSASPSVQPFQKEATATARSVVQTDQKIAGVATKSAIVAQKKIQQSPSPKPKTTVTPKSTVMPEVKKESISIAPKPGSLNPETLMSLINTHRQKIGKPAYSKDERLCTIAQQRAPQLHNEIFVTKNLHAGFRAMNLPWWVTENIAAYNSELIIFNFWMSDYIHKKAIESDMKYSCGACHGSSCSQLFSSFQAK